jgi:peroxiredoxin Q/BCP
MLSEGDLAPDFELRSDTDELVRLSSLRGKPVVLYFYPRDDTPGCTKQACGIRDSWGEIERAGAVVLGVSPQDEASHKRFKAKHDLPFPLLADTDHEVAELYGAWGEKFNYGKAYYGIIRSSFLIDAEGRVAKVWRKVNAGKHTDWVLANLPT